jgi:hypothetical protein
MLEVLESSDDPSARMEAEDAVWQQLLDQSRPEERARLQSLTRAERERLIQTAGEQYSDQLADQLADEKRQRRADDCS